MRDPSDNAFRASPLFQELERLTSEAVDKLDSAGAKRQHFIPMFLLARFVRPTRSGLERICQLDVQTGQPRLVAPRLAASRRHFYAIDDEAGARSNRLEGFLALVESHAAPALVRFLTAPEKLGDPDRATLSYFFALMNIRTPGAVDRSRSISAMTMKALLGTHLGDPETFVRDYEKYTGEAASAAEIERMRTDMLAALKTDRIGFSDPKGAAFHYDFRASGDLALLFYNMQWKLLRRAEAFVTSDRGLAIHDPRPRFPWSAQAPASSPYSETSIPLSLDATLVLSFAGEQTEVKEVGSAVADQINLRTYGWASRYVFCHSQECASRLRALAKRSKAQVVRPRPNHMVMLLEAERGAPSPLAEEHRRKGWPPYLASGGVLHDYVVLGIDGEPVEAAANVAMTVKERAQLVAAQGERVVGRATIESAELDD